MEGTSCKKYLSNARLHHCPNEQGPVCRLPKIPDSIIYLFCFCDERSARKSDSTSMLVLKKRRRPQGDLLTYNNFQRPRNRFRGMSKTISSDCSKDCLTRPCRNMLRHINSVSPLSVRTTVSHLEPNACGVTKKTVGSHQKS